MKQPEPLSMEQVSILDTPQRNICSVVDSICLSAFNPLVLPVSNVRRCDRDCRVNISNVSRQLAHTKSLRPYEVSRPTDIQHIVGFVPAARLFLERSTQAAHWMQHPNVSGGDESNIPTGDETMATKSKSAKRSNRGTKKESPDCTELLVLELQEIHNAESQLARAMPRLVKAVDSDQLEKLLDLRLEQGARLIQDIETALDEMEESPGRKKNVAAEGLINDAREHVQEIESGPSLDAVLIAAVQKTEHYCIAAWGTSRALAQALGMNTVVKTMERALKEGRDLDEQLTQLAEKEITPLLLSEEGVETDQEEDEDTETEATPSRARRGTNSERRAPN